MAQYTAQRMVDIVAMRPCHISRFVQTFVEERPGKHEPLYSPECLKAILDGPQNKIFLAIAFGSMRGFAWYKLEREEEDVEAHLQHLFVHPLYRSSGIGSRLLEHFGQWSAQNGKNDCYLYVRLFNHRAHALYTKHGYQDFFSEIGAAPHQKMLKMRKPLLSQPEP